MARAFFFTSLLQLPKIPFKAHTTVLPTAIPPRNTEAAPTATAVRLVFFFSSKVGLSVVLHEYPVIPSNLHEGINQETAKKIN